MFRCLHVYVVVMIFSVYVLFALLVFDKMFEWVFYWLFLISYCVYLKQWLICSTFKHNSTVENLRGWRFGTLVSH